MLAGGVQFKRVRSRPGAPSIPLLTEKWRPFPCSAMLPTCSPADCQPPASHFPYYLPIDNLPLLGYIWSGSLAMIAATPIRAISRSICTYATPRNPSLLNPFLSAHTKLPRICTFHSYFKSRPFCTYARTRAISFRFCRYKNRGDIPQ